MVGDYMSEMKLISVVLAINDEDKFQDCFDSLFNQTIGFDNIELLVKGEHDVAEKYENVKFIDSLDELSHSNSDYVMFINSDIEFSLDSLEFLHDNISNDNLDIVSGNFTHNDDFLETEIGGITDNPELLSLKPAVFTKIFKKDLILDNNIQFKNDNFTYDLTFISKCLLNANGIRYVDKPLCSYPDEKYYLNKRELMVFSKDLEEYYEMLHENDIEFSFDILENVWIKKFCLSDLSDGDKLDVLLASKLLFRKYEKFDMAPDKKLEAFINFINSKKYVYAVNLSKLLVLRYPESKDEIIQIIKNQEMYFVFFDLDMQPGGTGTAVINKANNLAKIGYKITLISIDQIKNYKYIKNHFYETGKLSRKVKVINIYEYYSDKNTISDEKIKAQIDSSDDLIVEEVKNTDNSTTYMYYDKNDPSKKVKQELFIDGVLVFRNDLVKVKRDYYTFDGFNYLTRIEKNKKAKYYLNDRFSSSTVEFTISNQLIYYFISKYCDTFNTKPFVICENTAKGFNINRVNPRETIKLGSMHGSPFIIDENGNKIINPNSPHFKILKDLKALVILTDSAYDDVLQEYEYGNFVSIPNFISDERLEYESPVKELNKIKIFSRISPEKNLSDAIRAFKIVTEHNDDAVLEIFGRQDLFNNNAGELDQLKSLVKELDIEEKVIFEGFLEDVDEEMRKALCTVLVSDHEGLPMSLLESMANSTPVISYDIDYGPRDVITDGVDGIIVKHGDYEDLAHHIIDLLDNPEKAIDMGIKAKEKIKNKFSATVVCKQWEDLFVKVYAETKISDYEQMIEERNYDKIVKRKDKFKKQRDDYKKQRNKYKKQRDKARKERAEARDERKKLKEKNKNLKKRIKSLESLKTDMLNSTSWKITKPLRVTKNYFKRK